MHRHSVASSSSVEVLSLEPPLLSSETLVIDFISHIPHIIDSAKEFITVSNDSQSHLVFYARFPNRQMGPVSSTSLSVRSCELSCPKIDIRRGIMKTILRILVLAAIPLGASNGVAQKVKVGYDKGTDFSKYTTYSWAEPALPVTRPVLFEAVVARVDAELQSKHLTHVSSDGDLTIMPSGGVHFGIAGEASTPYSPTYGGPPPVLNASMWSGSGGYSSAGAYVPEATLVLTFVERGSNKVVWSGSVKQKLDMEQKNKSLELADKAVIKLLKDFPAKK